MEFFIDTNDKAVVEEYEKSADARRKSDQSEQSRCGVSSGHASPEIDITMQPIGGFDIDDDMYDVFGSGGENKSASSGTGSAAAQTVAEAFAARHIKSGKNLAAQDDSKIISQVKTKYRIPSDVSIPDDMMDMLRPIFSANDEKVIAKKADKDSVWMEIATQKLEGKLYALGRAQITQATLAVKQVTQYPAVIDAVVRLSKLHSPQSPIDYKEIHDKLMRVCDAEIKTKEDDGKNVRSETGTNYKAERGYNITIYLIEALGEVRHLLSEEMIERHWLYWLLTSLKSYIPSLPDLKSAISFLKMQEQSMRGFVYETPEQFQQRLEKANKRKDRKSKNRSKPLCSASLLMQTQKETNTLRGPMDLDSNPEVLSPQVEVPLGGSSSPRSESTITHSRLDEQAMSSLAQRMGELNGGLKSIGDLSGGEKKGEEKLLESGKKAKKPEGEKPEYDRTVVMFILNKIDKVRFSEFPRKELQTIKTSIEAREGNKKFLALQPWMKHLEVEAERIHHQKIVNLIHYLWDYLEEKKQKEQKEMESQKKVNALGLAVGIANSGSASSSDPPVPVGNSNSDDRDRGFLHFEHHLVALMDPLVRGRLSIQEYVAEGRKLSALLDAEGLGNTKDFRGMLDCIEAWQVNVPAAVSLYVVNLLYFLKLKTWDVEKVSGVTIKQLEPGLKKLAIGNSNLNGLLKVFDPKHQQEQVKKEIEADQEMSRRAAEAAMNSKPAKKYSMFQQANIDKSKAKKNSVPLASSLPGSIANPASAASGGAGEKRAAPSSSGHTPNLSPDSKRKKTDEAVTKLSQAQNPFFRDDECSWIMGATKGDYGMKPKRGSVFWQNSVYSEDPDAHVDPFADAAAETGLADDNSENVMIEFGEVPCGGGGVLRGYNSMNAVIGVNVNSVWDANDAKKASPNPTIRPQHLKPGDAGYRSTHDGIFGSHDDPCWKNLLGLTYCAHKIVPHLEALYTYNETNKKGAKKGTVKMPKSLLKFKAVCAAGEAVVQLSRVTVPESPTTGYKPPSGFSNAFARLKKVSEEITKEAKLDTKSSHGMVLVNELVGMQSFVEKVALQIWDHMCPSSMEDKEEVEATIADAGSSVQDAMREYNTRFANKYMALRPLNEQVFTNLETAIETKRTMFQYDMAEYTDDSDS